MDWMGTVKVMNGSRLDAGVALGRHSGAAVFSFIMEKFEPLFESKTVA